MGEKRTILIAATIAVAMAMAAVGFILADSGNIPDSEGATSGTCGKNLTWTIDYAGNLKIEGAGPMEDYNYDSVRWGGKEIKSVKIGGNVTSIGNMAFSDCTSLTSVNIPDSVASIGWGAFENCTSLAYVIIGNKVTSIGDYAFFGCTSLELVTIGKSVTSIGNYAFYNCTSLTSVTIGNSVTSIGGHAFENCTSLASVTIGRSVTSIGAYAFYNCTSLTAIEVDSSNTEYASEDGVLYDKGKMRLLQYPAGKTDSSFSIPDSVTSIGVYAFFRCTSLTSVTIPDSVTSTEWGTFYECTSLASVTIGRSVTSIGAYAFYNCTSLAYVTIPDSVTSIGKWAFSQCTSLSSVTIGNSVTSIGEYAFYECTSLASVTIGNSVTSIGDEAFYKCTSLTSVTIPDSVTSIGNEAFYNCTSLTTAIIGNSVTSIGEGAFYNCKSLASVTIPDSVTSIGKWAFSQCTSLASVAIPDSVTTIGGHAFENCTSLASVAIPDSVTTIVDSAFSNCTSLTSATIGNSVTTIGPSAFSGCTSLTSITIPGSVTRILYYAFDSHVFYDSDEVTVLNKTASDLAGYTFKGETVDRMIKQDSGQSTKHSVTYDIDGGTGSAPEGGQYAEGETFVLPTYDGTKDGYIFEGWMFGGTVYDEGEIVTMISEDMTFVANWVPWKGVTSISLSETEIFLVRGEARVLTATVYPTDATVKDVVWTSSDESVATVDGYGKVTAVGPGEAIITATAVGGGASASCEVTVASAVSDDMTVYIEVERGGGLSAVVCTDDGGSVPAGTMSFIIGYEYRDGSGLPVKGSYSVNVDVLGGGSSARVFAGADKIESDAHYTQAYCARAEFVADGSRHVSETIGVSFSGSTPVSEKMIVSLKSAGDGDVYLIVASMDGGIIPSGKVTVELNYSVYSKALEDWVDRSDSVEVDLDGSDGAFAVQYIDLSDAKHPADYTSAVAMVTVGDGDDATTYLSDITGYSGKRTA